VLSGEGPLAGAAEQEQCLGEVDRSGVDGAQALVERAAVAVRIAAGDVENLEPLERGISPYRKYERWFHPLRFVSLVPLSHVFGQFLGIFLPQLLGGMVIFQESLTPAEVIRTIRRERVSVRLFSFARLS